jgi:hypothetical protein
MERVRDNHHGQRPDYAKRSEDIAREVLKDLKCTEKAEIRCCWVSPMASDPLHRAGPEQRIPALRIVFEGKTEMAFDPTRCEMSPVTTCAAFTICLRNFADGSVYADEVIRHDIRSQLEGYLGTFTVASGINAPVDFRLTEHEYA